MITAKFDGVRELINALEEFKKSISRMDIEKASEAALQPALPVAVSNLRSMVKRGTGNLESSLEVRKMSPAMRRRYGYYAGFYLGANYSYAPHAHLIEYGTGPRTRKSKNGKRMSTGLVTPKPFLRKTYESQRELIFERAAEVLRVRLDRKLKRALRKARKK
jgi:hypothetical protein